MWKVFMARVGVFLLTLMVGTWALFNFVMDWVGKSTVVEDFEALREKLPGLIQWLYTTPWWTPALIALALGSVLVWLSLPHRVPPSGLRPGSRRSGMTACEPSEGDKALVTISGEDVSSTTAKKARRRGPEFAIWPRKGAHMSSMKSYEEIVEFYRSHGVREMVPNDSRMHTEVLLRNVLLYALDRHEPVEIYTGKLSADVYGALATSARQVLGSNTIRMVCDNDPDDSEFLRTVLSSAKNGDKSDVLRIRNAKESPSGAHFMVAGGRAYRVEMDHNRCQAFGNFGDPDLGQTLNASFARLWESASPATKLPIGAIGA